MQCVYYEAHEKSCSAVALFPHLCVFGVVNEYSAPEENVHCLPFIAVWLSMSKHYTLHQTSQRTADRARKAVFILVLVREFHSLLALELR